MPKVWNIGNTTVRNPKRIENALKVFVGEGFSGNAKGKEAETRLHFMLGELGILEFEGQPSDLNGRKWRAAFYQLGFISFEEYNIWDKKLSVEELFKNIGLSEITKTYQLTPAGKKLIEATSVPQIEEIYTRQFACYEIPSTLEGSFPGGKMKPFILFLQVLRELNHQGQVGLNKFETGFFIQPFQNHTPDLPAKIVEGIVKYRVQFNKCKNHKEVKSLHFEYLEKLAIVSGINPNSVVGDYADTTFRYFTLSGLFTRISETINIRQNKIVFVDALLNQEPQFLFNQEPLGFFEYYYTNSYPLPIDDKSFAIRDIRKLKEDIKDKNHPLLKEANAIKEDTSIEAVQAIRHKLIIYNSWEREEDYANHQQSSEAVTDIINYLKTLNKENVANKPDIDDKPAFLEWAVWRSFLAIDEIVSKAHETRRFPVDQDFMPRNTAPGGGSDLIFEFEDYVLVVEVTLTISHRQMAVESEPVRRHTVQYKESYPQKDIYCLFIAPEVDNNVVETFRIGVWYKGDSEEFINIVPMSLGDFIKTIGTLQVKRYRNHDFRNLLDKCLVSRNVRAPQWKNSITKEVDEWVRKMSVIK